MKSDCVVKIVQNATLHLLCVVFAFFSSSFRVFCVTKLVINRVIIIKKSLCIVQNLDHFCLMQSVFLLMQEPYNYCDI